MITIPKSNIREMNPHPSMKEIGCDVDRYVIDSTRWSICSTNAIISITVREFVIRVYNTADFHGDDKLEEIKTKLSQNHCMQQILKEELSGEKT